MHRCPQRPNDQMAHNYDQIHAKDDAVIIEER